jgi:hypothetical protein
MTDREKIAYYYEVIAEIDPAFSELWLGPLLLRKGFCVRPSEFWHPVAAFLVAGLVYTPLCFVSLVAIGWIRSGGRFDTPSFYYQLANMFLIVGPVLGGVLVYSAAWARRKHGFDSWSEFGPDCHAMVRHRRLHPARAHMTAGVARPSRPPSQPLLDYFALPAVFSAAEIEAAVTQKIASVRHAIAKGDVDPLAAANELNIASAAIREHIAPLTVPDEVGVAAPTLSPEVSRPPPKLSKLTIVRTVLLILGLSGYIFRKWTAH